ncbi:hypothetical protein EDB84DRAFT_1669730 [Lactarius hengduanensis]|nr:hypothetical protein EDB84DRAFT_1669730 [Lactarius hengduanensis]
MADLTKAEMDQVFKVLKAGKGNKMCFDCQARNPTWASVTFGLHLSTNLDSWQLKLRTMKVGGNGSATDFFTRHGGSSLLNDSDVKKKYSSRVAELYREELTPAFPNDTSNLPRNPLPRATRRTSSHPGQTRAKAKPASPPPKPSAPPSRAHSPAAAAPRTITSSSLRSNSSAAASARTLTSSSTSSTGTGGLGAKKAAPVDFAEAERRAAEAERIRQLGYDREREEAEAQAAREAAALELKNKNAAATSTGPNRRPLPAPALRTSTAPVADDAPTTARDRFGGQKAISSDCSSSGFQGATSISSNQYFGREEEEMVAQGSDGGMLGDGNLAGLETAARDAVTRIMANPDVQNLGESLRTGALKLSDYLAQMSER